MILLLLLMAQVVDAEENTAAESAFCAGPQNDQPLRFCLADRKHERAARELAVALARARRVAVAQREEIRHFSRANGGVTLDGDPVRALETAQRAWERSFRADCVVEGLAVVTGNAGTEGVTAHWQCEADHMLDRVRFLTDTYTAER